MPLFSFALIFANGWFSACDGFMVLLLIGWVIWKQWTITILRGDDIYIIFGSELVGLKS